MGWSRQRGPGPNGTIEEYANFLGGVEEACKCNSTESITRRSYTSILCQFVSRKERKLGAAEIEKRDCLRFVGHSRKTEPCLVESDRPLQILDSQRHDYRCCRHFASA